MKKMFLMICLGIIVAAFINFFSFMISSMQLGGDALNGYEEYGRYYVSGNGKVAEVNIHHSSKAVSSPIVLRMSGTQNFPKVLREFVSGA